MELRSICIRMQFPFLDCICMHAKLLFTPRLMYGKLICYCELHDRVQTPPEHSLPLGSLRSSFQRRLSKQRTRSLPRSSDPPKIKGANKKSVYSHRALQWLSIQMHCLQDLQKISMISTAPNLSCRVDAVAGCTFFVCNLHTPRRRWDLDDTP